MPAIFLYSYGRALIVLHALFAVVLGGASVHLSVIAVRALFLRKLRRELLAIYPLVAFLGYLLTALSGALLYPRYRYFVRGLYLDHHAPWASNLFDFKENLATLGLPLSLGALILARGLPQHLESAPRDRAILLLYGFLTLGTASITLFNIVAGFICTSVHGI